MFKMGNIVQIKRSVFHKSNRINHYTSGKIGIVYDIVTLGPYLPSYALSILHSDNKQNIIRWYPEDELIYVCESINDLSDLEKLLYGLT